ncbi:MAG TPA: TetR/AcrR family transcriptional regulator [Dongiaceae bacterium]|nr:TetR/AcrR family transcriptional regulator [Dongiaceae bacterium]
MRYSKEHKAETRQQILIQAARHFLQDGIDGTGIAGLMAEAGLTHGGFYAHFKSKDDLVAAAIASGFRHTRAALAREAAKTGLEGVIRLYLDQRHRDTPSKGCIAALLSQEIARLPKKVRASFTTEVAELLQLIAELLPMPEGRKRLTREERSDRAIMILSSMMGSLQLARAITDPALSDRILACGIEAALQLARHA